MRNIFLWIAQGLLCLFLLAGAAMKLLMPIPKLAAMMPWMGQVPVAFVHFTGIIDLLGALGIVLPRFTVWAAFGIIALMICAIVFHLSRGETVIEPNIIIMALAGFVAWGRLRQKS